MGTVIQCKVPMLTHKVQGATIDAQWEGMGMYGRRGTRRHYFPLARP